MEYLRKSGFDISGFGNAHVVLNAPSLPFRLGNGLIVTKECVDLYNFIRG